MNWLLLVGTGKEPDFEVTLADNMKNIFEEYGTELILMFILGILIGILISYIYSKIRNLIQSHLSNKSNDNKE